MSFVGGLLSASTASTDDLVGEWQRAITVRHSIGVGSGDAKLFALMQKLRTEPAEAQEFNWFERDPVRSNVYSNASFNSSVTTLTFDDGSGNAVWAGFAKNLVLENSRTGEYVRVTADPTDASITVERDAVGTVAAAINDNDLWTIIGIAQEDGSDPTKAVYETPDKIYNYVQTYPATVFIANAYKGSVLRTDIEGPLRNQRLYALEKVSRDIEHSFLFGRRHRQSGSNGFIYHTGGIRDAITNAGLDSTHILDGQDATGVSLETFNDWLQAFMVYGSTMKLAFCGPQAFSAVSRYANEGSNGYRIMQNETVFGMNITTIMTPFGALELTLHPLMQTDLAYKDLMVVVDLQNVVQKVMEPLFLEPNVQSNGQDAYKEQFRAKLGLKLGFANAFGWAHDLQKINANA